MPRPGKDLSYVIKTLPPESDSPFDGTWISRTSETRKLLSVRKDRWCLTTLMKDNRSVKKAYGRGNISGNTAVFIPEAEGALSYRSLLSRFASKCGPPIRTANRTMFAKIEDAGLSLDGESYTPYSELLKKPLSAEDFLKRFQEATSSLMAKIPYMGTREMAKYLNKIVTFPGDLKGSASVSLKSAGWGYYLTTMSYKNYSDHTGVTFNGSQITYVNISADGWLYGTLGISGDVSGSITLGNPEGTGDSIRIIDGVTSTGSYTVTAGGVTEKLSVSVING